MRMEEEGIHLGGHIWRDYHGFWFADETEDTHGPYNSYEEADRALDLYCDLLENGPPRALVHVYSPYGLITRHTIHQYQLWAQCFWEGWVAARNPHYSCEEPQYADIRDFLLGVIDMEYEYACQVALYMCPEARRKAYLDDLYIPSPFPFFPIV